MYEQSQQSNTANFHNRLTVRDRQLDTSPFNAPVIDLRSHFDATRALVTQSRHGLFHGSANVETNLIFAVVAHGILLGDILSRSEAALLQLSGPNWPREWIFVGRDGERTKLI